jgi:taurine transport system permease protein
LGKRYEKTWNRGEGAGKYTYAMLSAAGVLGFFLLWQLAVESGLVSSRYITKPTELVGVFLRKMYDSAPDGSTLPSNILASLKVALSGLALAILIGVPLGWLMGWYGEIDAFMKPLFEIIRPIPPVSWIPLTITWLGIGLGAKAFIIFFSAFVPCVINSYTGIRQTKSILINVAKTCGASNFTIFRKVGIPSSLPVTFAGIRVALGNAWSTLVAAEMLAANVGLGYMIQMGRTFARPDIIILGMVVIGAFGAFFAAMLDLMEKRFVKGGGNRG